MLFDEVVTRLQRRSRTPPEWPGELDARVILAAGSTAPWDLLAPSGPPRDAAALVLLYPSPGGEAHVVLTVRPAGDHVHSGQVALPGGKREPGDRFPVGTALREAEEEIGLDPALAGVRTLGTLGAIDVRVSGFLMVPVIAVAEREPELRPDPREVAEVLLVPVATFLPGAPIEVVDEVREGWHLRFGAYPVGSHRVWGATARVMGQLGSALGDPSVRTG
jgi:8-oxo-dGTP pyrophosphatase MutT (NUDIX family)